MLNISQIKSFLTQHKDVQFEHSELAPYRKPLKEYNTQSARKASVMLLLYQEVDHLNVVVIKRPSYDGHHSNQIAFPGGKSEREDDSPLETAYRETEEEVGISASEIEYLGELSPLFIPPSNFLVYPFVGFIPSEPQFTPDPIEVEEIITFPLTRLFEQDVVKHQWMEHSSSLRVKTPYFDIENQVIWGATAIILDEFRQIIRACL